MALQCEDCLYYEYDEEAGDCGCGVDMDEDEYAALSGHHNSACPYYRRGDEYSVVRKQYL